MERYQFRPAREQEAPEILRLYKSVLSDPLCVWDEDYPGMEEILEDLQTQGLFVVCLEGKIQGAISIVPHNEMDDQPCWSVQEPDAREIARVAVVHEARGRGLAGYMVAQIGQILRDRGYKAVHLAAAQVNAPAWKTYRKAGYREVGRGFVFGHDYIFMEIDL